MKISDVAIKTPCTLNFGLMTPADGGRFCGDCKKVVRDLSALDEPGAKALLQSESADGLCVRYLADRHGNIFFGQPTPKSDLIAPSLLLRAKRAVKTAVAMAAPLVAMACTVPQADDKGGGVTDPTNPTNPDYQELMGAAPYYPPPDAGADSDAGADGADTDGGTTKDSDASDATPPPPPKT